MLSLSPFALGRSALIRNHIVGKRLFSAVSVQSKVVKQGGLLKVNLAECPVPARVVITSKWQETIDISYDDDIFILTHTEEDELSNTLSIAVNKLNSDDAVLRITIPEYLDMNVTANIIDLQLQNKMQGDIRIASNSGTIVADKLRGAILDFNCNDTDITIKKLLEGNSHILCRALKAKMINGDTVQIAANDIDVDAIYGAYTHLEAVQNITVGLSRGDMEAYSELGNISVSGVDGSFDILADRGTVRLQVNKLYPAKQHQIPGEDMYLEEGSPRGSYASAPEGHIIAVVDPELAGSIHCRSESAGLQRVCVTVNSDAFDLDTTSDPDGTGTDEAIRMPRVGTWEGGVIKGVLTGKSAGVKRPSGSEGNGGSGKINLRGAESQSQVGLTMQERNADIDSSYSSPPSDQQSSGEGEYDLTLTARGNVRVDTMSWIQVIRSKYGFEDSLGGTLPPSTPGRTASSNANAAKIANSIFDEK